MTVLAIGNFDGFHLGHQELIKEAQRLASELGTKPALLTFFPHPHKVLKKNSSFQEIITLEEKKALSQSFGLKKVFVIDFSEEFSAKSPELFLEELMSQYNIQGLVTGEDFRFGYQRAGSSETIKNFAKKNFFPYRAIRRLSFQDINLSSSLLREVVTVGAFKLFKKLTGRNYTLKVEIDWTKRLGRVIALDIKTPPPGAFLVKVDNIFFLLVFFSSEEFFLENLSKPCDKINTELQEVQLLEILGEGLDKYVKDQLLIENLIKNAKFILNKYDF